MNIKYDLSVIVSRARTVIRRSVNHPPESGRFIPIFISNLFTEKQLPVEGHRYCLFYHVKVSNTTEDVMVWLLNLLHNSFKLKNGVHLVELHEVEEMGDTPEASHNVAYTADTNVTAVLPRILEMQISL